VNVRLASNQHRSSTPRKQAVAVALVLAVRASNFPIGFQPTASSGQEHSSKSYLHFRWIY